jgi:aminoglycoside 3-N-acetyltransferase
MDINKIMGISPYLEVMIRNIYWHVPALVRRFNREKKAEKGVNATTSAKKVADYLASQGVGKNDLIILHSSFKTLRGGSQSPLQVIDLLLDLIGEGGTLAMPAIPVFKGQPGIIEGMTADVSNLILDYDPKESRSWTGILPDTLVQHPGSVRSLHPLNTLVAVGPLATSMMKDNLSGEKPLPCGRQSSWYFCYLNDAKIISVGADLAHSLTMIHVAEDMWDDAWVIPDWYRERIFRVKQGLDYKTVTVRERRPKWAMHYAERTLSKDLIRSGIAKKGDIDGVNVEIVNAKPLINYLNSRNHSGYPYYMVPNDHRRIRNRKCHNIA